MKQTILTFKQSDLLENLIVNYGQIVTSHQIFKESKPYWNYRQSKNLITKLVKNGWLIRIKRGLYIVTDLSSRGVLTLSPYVVANLLVFDSYVSFESALSYHGMFSQLSKRTVSVSLKEVKLKKIAGNEYSFVKTKPELFFGWQNISMGNTTFRMATPEKAIIDLVNFHKSRYSIDLVIEMLMENKNELNLKLLNKYLAKYPITTIKIFGFIYDLIGINSDSLRKLPARGTHWMIPGDNKFNAKWRLYYNNYFDKYQI